MIGEQFSILNRYFIPLCIYRDILTDISQVECGLRHDAAV